MGKLEIHKQKLKQKHARAHARYSMLPCCGSHTVNALFGSSAMLVGLFEQNQNQKKGSGENKIHTVVTINFALLFVVCYSSA